MSSLDSGFVCRHKIRQDGSSSAIVQLGSAVPVFVMNGSPADRGRLWNDVILHHLLQGESWNIGVLASRGPCWQVSMLVPQSSNVGINISMMSAFKQGCPLLGQLEDTTTSEAVPCHCRTIDTGTVTEAHVTLLLNSGLLVRDMQESDVYLFSMAGAGPIVKSLLRQRKVRQCLRSILMNL